MVTGGSMKRMQLLLLAGGSLLVAACSSTPVKATEPKTQSAATAPATASGAPALTGVRSESGETPQIVLAMAGKPGYASYSPQPDVFVVDLQRAVKASDLQIPSDLPAPLASISAEEAMELGIRLTRVTMRFSEPVKVDTTERADGGLAVAFSPRAETSIAAAQPMVDEPQVESAPIVSETAAVEVEPVAVAAIEDADLTGAPAATALRSVSTSGSGSELQIALGADGVVDYKIFKLSNPLRLVVDMPGVHNKVKQPTLDLGDPFVKRVRVATFKSAPAPVTRVVLDMDELVDHRVVRQRDGLKIVFGAAADLPLTSTQTAATKPADVNAAPRAEVTRLAETRREPVVETRREPVVEPRRETFVANSAADAPPPMVSAIPQETRPPANLVARNVAAENVFSDAPQVVNDRPVAVSGGTISPGTSRTLTPGERTYDGDPISLELNDAEIRDVLRTFAQLTGLNIAIDPQVSGRVTVNFQNIPWDQAFEIILKQNGLGFVQEGNVIRVGTLDRLSQEQDQIRTLAERERLNVELETVIKHLSYAKAADVSSLLREMASPRGKIIVDSRTNQLVITEIPTYLRTMLGLIETIDIPTPQVVIEARIVETTKNFSRQLGVQWGFEGALDPALGSGTGLNFPNRVGVTGGPFNFGAGNPVLTLSFGNVLGTFDLDIVLTAAEAEGLARIVSAPKVTTQDNQLAEIQSGVQIPIQTRVNFTTTVTYIDATLRLTVTPQVTAEDTVIMDIQVQKTEPVLGLAVVGGTNSPLTTRRAQTKLMVRDGGTTVIGGIYQATENRAQTRLPIVHQIPVLGNLFKSRTIDSRHDELLIFITPRIVRNS